MFAFNDVITLGKTGDNIETNTSRIAFHELEIRRIVNGNGRSWQSSNGRKTDLFGNA